MSRQAFPEEEFQQQSVTEPQLDGLRNAWGTMLALLQTNKLQCRESIAEQRMRLALTTKEIFERNEITLEQLRRLAANASQKTKPVLEMTITALSTGLNTRITHTLVGVKMDDATVERLQSGRVGKRNERRWAAKKEKKRREKAERKRRKETE